MSVFIPGCVREHRRTGGHKHSHEARQVDGVLGALGAAVLVPPEAAAGLVAPEPPEPPVPPPSALGVAAEPESALVVVGLAAGDFFAPPESVL